MNKRGHRPGYKARTTQEQEKLERQRAAFASATTAGNRCPTCLRNRARCPVCAGVY